MTNYRSGRERSERNKILIIFGVVYVIIIFTIMIIVASALSYDKVYSGVTLDKSDVSGMTREEIAEMINSEYNSELASSIIYFKIGETSVTSMSLKDLSIKYNTEEIVNALYKPGHEGSMVDRIKEIMRLSREPQDIKLFGDGTLAEFDETVLKAKIGEIISKTSANVIEHNIVKDEVNKQLKIITGGRGLEIDREQLKNLILEKAAILIGSENKRIEDYEIRLESVSKETKPVEFDVTNVYNMVNKPAENAKYVKDGNTVTIAKEVVGEVVNIADLVSVSQQIVTAEEGYVFTIPITLEEPKVKESTLSAPTFNDVIGKGSTKVSSTTDGRGFNIAKATLLINGYILLPGEEFSFNDYIGDTTQDKGYQPAIGYENGDKVETYGGGVCQVSSTLYAALMNGGLDHGGLKILRRLSHSMTVSYVKPGYDAAVAFWAGKDIKFKNELDVPIKISGGLSGTTLTFEILGVNKNKGKYQYSYETSGPEKFKENDKNYEKYITYQTVKEGGSVIVDKQQIGTSTYLIP